METIKVDIPTEERKRLFLNNLAVNDGIIPIGFCAQDMDGETELIIDGDKKKVVFVGGGSVKPDILAKMKENGLEVVVLDNSPSVPDDFNLRNIPILLNNHQINDSSRTNQIG